MKISAAVEVYVAEMKCEGRFNSPHTEASYRAKLDALGEAVGNRDPRIVGRDELKASCCAGTATANAKPGAETPDGRTNAS